MEYAELRDASLAHGRISYSEAAIIHHSVENSDNTLFLGRRALFIRVICLINSSIEHHRTRDGIRLCLMVSYQSVLSTSSSCNMESNTGNVRRRIIFCFLCVLFWTISERSKRGSQTHQTKPPSLDTIIPQHRMYAVWLYFVADAALCKGGGGGCEMMVLCFFCVLLQQRFGKALINHNYWCMLVFQRHALWGLFICEI